MRSHLRNAVVLTFLESCTSARASSSREASRIALRERRHPVDRDVSAVPDDLLDASVRVDTLLSVDDDRNTVRWICTHGLSGPLPVASGASAFPPSQSGELRYVVVIGGNGAQRLAILHESLADRRRPGVGLYFSAENGIADSFEARLVLSNWRSWRATVVAGEIAMVEPAEHSGDPMAGVELEAGWRRRWRAWYTQRTHASLSLSVDCDGVIRTVSIVSRRAQAPAGEHSD